MPAWTLSGQGYHHPDEGDAQTADLARHGAARRQGQPPLKRFIPASLAILAIGMVVISWWLSTQIASSVIRRTTQTNALYIESFVAPLLAEGQPDQLLSGTQAAKIDAILNGTPLGRELVAFIVWGSDGTVLYSSDRSQVGKRYPLEETIRGAWDGAVTWELDRPGDEVHVPQQHRARLLLATYAPVRHPTTDQIIAVTEFYQNGDPLVLDIESAQHGTWLIVGTVTLAMFFVFVVFIRSAGRTIVRQQSELSEQVEQLTDLLAQNAELNGRIAGASRRAAMLNERFLRRVSSELHDGPAQYLSLALLHIDRVGGTPDGGDEHRRASQSAVQQALQEIRELSAGLGLPQIEQLSLPDAVARAVRSHERRTQTVVDLTCADLPERISPECKLTLYRVLQESLMNAYRHGGGVGQRVRVWADDRALMAEICDGGRGFAPEAERPAADAREARMGIAGMRERIECLGGVFRISSAPGAGTSVYAEIPLHQQLEHAT